MSGRVRYYSVDIPVEGVALALHGDQEGVAASDAVGSFAFENLAGGTWSIDPSKTSVSLNGVTSLDAAYILQVAVGKRTFTSLQAVAADVTGDGTVTPLDASRILQFVVGKLAKFPVAGICGSDWAFVPNPVAAANQQVMLPLLGGGTCQHGEIAYVPLAETVSGQNFLGVLFGDCTGNWQP